MRFLKFLGGIVATVVAVVVVLQVLPGSLNPFRTRDVDRSQPAVLQSISDIGEFRASSANLQLVIDLERDTRFVPDFIKGERTLFVAAGTVDAGVDMTKMTPDAVRVDGRSATVTLPPIQLFPPTVDMDKSYTVDRQRGVIDRIGGLFGDGNDEHAVYQMAERKLREAAAADPQVRRRAEDNTTRMLTSLLKSLGFETVNIVYAPEPGT